MSFVKKHLPSTTLQGSPHEGTRTAFIDESNDDSKNTDR